MEIVLDLKALHAASFAMGKEESRYYLQGVLIECKSNLINYVATNGQILIKTVQFNKDVLEFESFIMPAKTVEKIIKGAKEYKNQEIKLLLAIEDNKYTVKVNGHNPHDMQIIGFEPIAGSFPDYKRIIPQILWDKPLSETSFNPLLLMSISKGADVFTNKKDVHLKLTFCGDKYSPVLVSIKNKDFLAVLMPSSKSEQD